MSGGNQTVATNGTGIIETMSAGTQDIISGVGIIGTMNDGQQKIGDAYQNGSGNGSINVMNGGTQNVTVGGTGNIGVMNDGEQKIGDAYRNGSGNGRAWQPPDLQWVAKRDISTPKTGRIALRNGPYRSAKRQVLRHNREHTENGAYSGRLVLASECTGFMPISE